MSSDSAPYPIPSNRARPVTPPAPSQKLTQLMQGLLQTDVSPPSLILTIVPEEGILRHEVFTAEEALLTRVRELLDGSQEVAVSISFGYRLAISKPPLRYLVAPWGNIPLFDPLPQQLQLEEDGFLGRRYDEFLPLTEQPDDDADVPVAEESTESTEEGEEPLTVDDDDDIFSQTLETDEE
jgi:hypothetical protein